MKVEVVVLGSTSLIVRTVSVDVEQHSKKKKKSRRRRRRKRRRKDDDEEQISSCVKVEVDFLCSPSLTVRTVSVDVKQHLKKEEKKKKKSVTTE